MRDGNVGGQAVNLSSTYRFKHGKIGQIDIYEASATVR